MTHNLKGLPDFIRTESILWDSSWPESAKEERDDILSFLEHRFGIERCMFKDYLLLKKNKSWWLLRKSGHIGHASSLKVVMTGLKAFQTVGRYIKPTTRMIQCFGRHAVRARLDISESDLKKMSEGCHIYSDMKIDNGYIILAFNGAVLGLGLFIDGKVMSQMPRRDLVLIALE